MKLFLKKLLSFSIFTMIVQFVLSSNVEAQIVQNHLYDFDQTQSHFYSINLIDETIFGFGNAILQEPNLAQELHCAKINRNGKLLKHKYFGGEGNFAAVNNTRSSFIIDDSLYVFAGFPYSGKLFQLDLDLEDHNLLDTFSLLEEETAAFVDFINDNDSILLFSSGHSFGTGIDFTVYPQISIYNLQTRKSKKIQFNLPDMEQIISGGKLLVLDDDRYLHISTTNNSYLFDDIYDTEFRAIGIEFDGEGNMLKKELIKTNDQVFRGEDILLLNDYIYYIAQKMRTVLYTPGPTPDWDYKEWQFRHVIYKMDKDYNVIWDQDFDLEWDENPYSYSFKKLIPSNEKDGIIVVGTVGNIIEEPLDSLRETGIIAKITEQGDSLWLKSYIGFDHKGSGSEINDIIPAADGEGYWVAGVSLSGGLEIQNWLQAWLFKIDNEGNIVTDSISGIVPVGFEEKINIYPNPSSDVVYIDQKNIEIKSYHFRDASGKLLKTCVPDISNAVYMLDVSPYHSGLYYLEIIATDGRRSVEEIIVTR